LKSRKDGININRLMSGIDNIIENGDVHISAKLDTYNIIYEKTMIVISRRNKTIVTIIKGDLKRMNQYRNKYKTTEF
jgi:hypothetical protein